MLGGGRDDFRAGGLRTPSQASHVARLLPEIQFAENKDDAGSREEVEMHGDGHDQYSMKHLNARNAGLDFSIVWRSSS